ncbi:MAG: DUF2023 family protein [Candidatus Altiarchaeum hamiconexum]|nr:DUF2023 family protein [Candidatus Altarchaeum hamiconexum]
MTKVDPLFVHHIYEYKKGLRNLVLHTTNLSDLSYMEEILKRKQISYIAHRINETRANIFFGDRICLDVVKSFGRYNLRMLTPEEDFILGIMLGYSRDQECLRYIQLKNNRKKNEKKVEINNEDQFKSIL